MWIQITVEALFALTFIAALGSGLVAGVFFAFSGFVMKALAHLPPEQGIRAMQAINVAVINPVFLGAFLGTAVVCGVVVVAAVLDLHTAAAAYLLCGSLLYLAGTMLVTFACNVPRNAALARVDASSADAADVWSSYVTSWTAWNHVRTAAAFAASASLTVGLC